MNNNIKKCFFCNGSHSCRNCPIESKIAPFMKKIIGQHMENFTATKLLCPRCSKPSLKRLGNHTPSLDIICMNCCTNFEVKSKCLSVDILPKDLILHHGNYFDYLSRQSNGLDFIIIIYKVNRISKIIQIRKILHILNENIYKTNTPTNFYITPDMKSPLSKIHIEDHTKLNEIKISDNYNYNFTNDIKNLLKTIDL